tara:strand:+ start:45714 stop:46793 length:1080 start_codon:yes stop_codon:yes gene_type:complete
MLLKGPTKAPIYYSTIKDGKGLSSDTTLERVDDVAYKKLSKFEAKLNETLQLSDRVDGSFEKRISALRSVSTDCGGVHKIWLILNEQEMLRGAEEKCMLLLMKPTSEFKGNAIPLEEIKKEFTCDMENFYVFSLLDDEAASKPNLELRVSLDGRVGEITWIESNATVSGNDLFKVFELISDFLKIENVILRDASQDNQGLPIRVLRPLIKSDEKTWYQSKKFEVYDCNDVKILGEQKYFHQSKINFKKSVETLRNFNIRDLLSLFPKRKDKAKYKKIINRSLDLTSTENTDNINLSQLFEGVFTKSTSGERGCKTARKDLCYLYENILNPERYKKIKPELEKASATLHETGLFVRKAVR